MGKSEWAFVIVWSFSLALMLREAGPAVQAQLLCRCVPASLARSLCSSFSLYRLAQGTGRRESAS